MNSTFGNYTFMSVSVDPSEVEEADPKDVIEDLIKLDKERKVEWEALFNKYEAQVSQNVSYDVEDLSRIFNNSTVSTSSRISRVSRRSRSKTTNRNRTCTLEEMMQPLSYLYRWTTPDEMDVIAEELLSNKIDLEKLITIIEVELRSDLRPLLVFHEEARYLQDESFKELHHLVHDEMKRLHQYLDKKYIVIYIIAQRSDVRMDQIIHKIEKELNGNLLECFSLTTQNNGKSARIKSLLHQNFVREWTRLRQNVPTDILVAYCNMIESQLLMLRANQQESDISPLQLLQSLPKKGD